MKGQDNIMDLVKEKAKIDKYSDSKIYGSKNFAAILTHFSEHPNCHSKTIINKIEVMVTFSRNKHGYEHTD